LVTKQLTAPIDIHYVDFYQYNSKYRLLCSTEDTHTGLEQHEDEQIIHFSFLGVLSL